MPKKVFISFERTDSNKVNDLRALAKNPNNKLTFIDGSELKPVIDDAGNKLGHQPENGPQSQPIKDKLKELLLNADKMVVVVGDHTNSSKWVEWEIQVFHDNRNNTTKDGKFRLLRMMITDKKKVPTILNTYGIDTIPWDTSKLNKWIKK